jgi:chromosome segregation ATPase
MTDIVARLGQMPSSLNDACRTMEEAKAEIERLRGEAAETASAKETIDGLRAYIERLLELAEPQQAEIERLRKAIKRIYGINDNPACFNLEIQAALNEVLRP